MAELESNFKFNSPIGVVLPYSGATAPLGWLICDGRLLVASVYKELYDVIGYRYGGENGAFYIPDMREVVPVGIGTRNANIIHDVYTLGQFKDDQSQNHSHIANFRTSRDTDEARISVGCRLNAYPEAYGSATNYIGGPKSGRFGDVTRGKRIGMNYIIHAASLIKVNGSSWTPA